MDTRLSGKILKNTAYNTLGRGWSTLVALFLTPYIIHRLGVERYGIWAFVSAIVGYFGLLDFGISSSFVRYIAQFNAKKDIRSINELVNTGFVFYALFGMAVFLLATRFMHPLAVFFKIPGALMPEAIFVFLTGIFIFMCSNAISPFTAVQTGLQRMDIQNNLAIAVSLPNIAGTVYVLEKGYGLPGVMVVMLCIFLLNSIASVIIAFRLLPGLEFRPFTACTKKMMVCLFNFGSRFQLARISGVVTSQTDKMLITYFFTVGMVTFYQLGSSLVSYSSSVAALLVAALMPAFTELATTGSRAELLEAYFRSLKYLGFVIVPVFFFLILAAPQILFMWVGLGYGKSVAITRILAVGFFLNTLAQVSASVCIAVDKPGLMARASVIIIVLSVGLSLVLLKLFGFNGVAWGSAAAVNIGTCYFLYRLHGHLAIPNRKMVRIVLPFLFSAAVAYAAAWGVELLFFRPGGAPLTRLTVLGLLAVKFTVFAALYAVGVFRARVFDSFEKKLVAERFPFLAVFVSTPKEKDEKAGG